MQTELLTINTEALPTHTRLVLEGEIDAGTSRTLDQAMNQLLTADGASVVIDVRDVNYISSAGIGIFIFFFGELKKLNRKLILLNPTPVVHEILTLLRLEEHIPILMSEEEVEAQLNS